MSNRVWNMSIKPYDQVLALTQHMINEGISNLYTRQQVEQIVDGSEKPKPVSISFDEYSSVKDIELGPPTVIIKPEFSNSTTVHIRIHLKKGNITLRKWLETTDEGIKRDVVLKLSIQDWFVTVPVDVKFEPLPTNAKDLAAESLRVKAIRERSKAKDGADFSIYELLMDLSTMRSNDGTWEMGKWTKDDYLVTRLAEKPEKQDRPLGWKLDKQRQITEFDDEWQTSLELILPRLAKSIQKANLNSLGFAVMAKNANKKATFEVNDTRYQTYPWVNPETKIQAGHGLDGDSRLNYLLYLQTVGQNKPPNPSLESYTLPVTMGNWTDGRKPGKDIATGYGSFVLSASNFMDGFILKKFSAINRCMSNDIYNVKARCRNENSLLYYGISVSYMIGRTDPTGDEKQFELKRGVLSIADDWHPDAKDLLRPLTESPGNDASIWVYEDIEWGPTAKHSHANDVAIEHWVHGDTITFARAYTLPGTNRIVYEGRTWTKLEAVFQLYTYDNWQKPQIMTQLYEENHMPVPSIYEGKKSTSTLILRVQWKVTLDMAEATDGGLKIAVKYQKPKVSKSILRNGDEAIGWGDIERGVEKAFNNAGENFEVHMNSVRNCLEGQEGFALPASGVFYFKNPIMDKHANLLCDVSYNGVPKRDQAINPEGASRDKVSPGKEVPPQTIVLDTNQ